MHITAPWRLVQFTMERKGLATMLLLLKVPMLGRGRPRAPRPRGGLFC